ncbi:MAG: AmmeMemoRadiSam system protein A [Parcubacteria group bacterium]|jgi:AmmeMemoRadiSam system protein A
MERHIQLAKKAIEKFVKTGKKIEIPSDLPPNFYEKEYGVFVSLHRGDKLRGCIGTYLPQYRNLAEEIIQNAIAASSEDYRFPPVTADEINNLEIKVSLLNQPEKIGSLEDLDAKKYGIIVKSTDGKCGLLLPDLEGVESVEQQISIACQKAGINLSFDKDIEISRFEVTKYPGENNQES